MDGRIPDVIPASITDLGVTAIFSYTADIMIQLELVFDAHLDRDRLRRALQLILDAEPVLGCRLVHDSQRPYWKRLPADARENFSVFESERDYESYKVEPLDASRGPCILAGLYSAEGRDRLWLKVAHEVADAGGAKDAAYLLASIYRKLKDDPDYVPEPNLSGDRTPDQVTKRIPWYSWIRIFLNFVREALSENIPGTSFSPYIGEVDRETRRYAKLVFDRERVGRMKAHAKKHGGTLNDIIFAAMFRACAGMGWDGKKTLRMRMSVDLRKWYLPEGRAQALANLSGQELCVLGKDLGTDLGATTARVAAFTARRKRNWFGMNLYSVPINLGRIMSFDGFKKLIGKMMAKNIAKGNIYPMFTNLGPVEEDRLKFDELPLECTAFVPAVYPPFIGAGLSGYLGALTFTAGSFCKDAERLELMVRLVDEELPA